MLHEKNLKYHFARTNILKAYISTDRKERYNHLPHNCPIASGMHPELFFQNPWNDQEKNENAIWRLVLERTMQLPYQSCDKGSACSASTTSTWPSIRPDATIVPSSLFVPDPLQDEVIQCNHVCILSKNIVEEYSSSNFQNH